ncbi:hypothetical protein GC163_14255 [bacterium]|nr:hypothetical protein [bacterium]
MRGLWLALLGLVLMSPRTADALVIMGDIEPGQILLSYGWAQEAQFRELLAIHPHIGGKFMDAPSWWDGHYSAEYFYQGDSGELQKVIHALDKLSCDNVKIVIVQGEGFWEPDNLVRQPGPQMYDWSLQFSETKIRDAAQQRLYRQMIINEPIVVLAVYDSDQLDLTSLWVPYRLLVNPRIPSAAQVVGQEPPADALHAIARTKRSR